jgi:aspartate racemase
VSIPFLDMVRLAVARLSGRRIGVLATPAVQKIGLYASRLKDAGFAAVFPDAADEARLLNIIRAVKANALDAQHRRDYAEIAAALDADACLLACTELSVIGAPDGATKPVVDALDALVEETVAKALS